MYFDLTVSLDEEPRYYTVIPSPDVPCNETEQCLTLSQFANNSSEYVGTNVMLHFVQGEHCIASTMQIEKSLSTFSMSLSSYDSNVTIVCNYSSVRFEFNNVNVVHISDLTFIGCAGNKFINISRFTLKDSQFIGHKDIIGTALEIVETSAKLIRTDLSNNRGSRVTSLYCHDGFLTYDFLNDYYSIKDNATAGGAIVSTRSNVTIIEGTFEGNSAQAGGAIFAELQSNITIINSTFVGNQATSLQSHPYCYIAGGGALYSDSGSSVVIHSSTFEHNTAHWIGGVMATGYYDNTTIAITNISNAANYLGGVLFSNDYSNITILYSEFRNNSANIANSKGGVLFCGDYSNITIANSQFTDNGASSQGGVLYMFGTPNSRITITDSKFIKNYVESEASAYGSSGGVMSIIYVYYLLSIVNSFTTVQPLPVEGFFFFVPNI